MLVDEELCIRMGVDAETPPAPPLPLDAKLVVRIGVMKEDIVVYLVCVSVSMSVKKALPCSVWWLLGLLGRALLCVSGLAGCLCYCCVVRWVSAKPVLHSCLSKLGTNTLSRR